MTPLLRGSIVHSLLERLDHRRPVAPTQAELETAIERHGLPLRAEELADLRGMIERVLHSPLRERIARARRVRAELPFAYTLTPPGAGGRSLLVNGVVDVLAHEEEATLVVDWKSDALDGRDPELLVADAYSTQRLVYALAALRARAERVEVVHVFLERPHEPVAVRHEAGEVSELERRLGALLEDLLAARYRPADAPGIELCAGCPGRAALCSWPPERTGSPRAGAPGHAAPIAA